MDSRRYAAGWFGLTIFCSAFLLFQVQPIMGRLILPWFGGTPMTWTLCLLFFQSALLAGYLYAHLLSSLAQRKVQVAVHFCLLLAAAATLPFAPDASWKPAAGTAPAGHVLLLLLVHVGGPFFMLSSTNPLLQQWFSTRFRDTSPYRLYALSNTGSLLALVTYPFVIEPSFTVKNQVLAWSGLYVLYIAGSAACAVLFLRAPRKARAPSEADHGANQADRPAVGDMAMWVLLAAAASAMLMATTNQLCQEIAAVPFLYILPLCLYLLSFIICFDSERWYDRRVWGALLITTVPLASHVLVEGVGIALGIQLAMLSAVLFACCMTCHGEVVRSRPAPRYLTLFYLLVAGGGALGGAFVAVGAPLWFGGYWEFHIALAGTCLLTFVAWYRRAPWRDLPVKPVLVWGAASGFLCLLVLTLGLQAYAARHRAVCVRRSFFGVLSVEQTRHPDGKGSKEATLSMLHGRITHGFQFTDPGKARWATSYYGPGTGVYLALNHHPARKEDAQAPLRVGLVGLGTGTLAALGRPGDYFRFYEINPDVVELARDRFTFLDDSPAEIDFVLGDARLELEREVDAGQPQGFDLLVLDAFISDAVPVHLLTVECVGIYLRHLKPDGLLALHISNRFVDLAPVVLGVAEHYGLQADFVYTPRDNATGVSQSRWAILTADSTFSEQAEVQPHLKSWSGFPPTPIVWTDDFASLWPVIIW